MAGRDPHRRREREYDDYPTESTRTYYESGPPRQRTEHEHIERDVRLDSEIRRREIIFAKISNVVWFFAGLIEALIAIRVLLRLLNANEGNAFVSFVYDISYFFVRPFDGIVNEPSSDGSVLEINSLIAMLVYLLITWALLRLTWVILDVTAPAEEG